MKQTPAGRSGGSRWNDDNNKEAKVFHDYLERLAAAGTANEIAKVRVDIADAVTAGKLTEVAADSLQACARAAAESIAAHGERRPSKPVAPSAGGEERVAATITECGEVSYDDSGEQIRGVVSLESGDTIRFSIKKSWSGSIRAIYGAAGVADDQPAEALTGAAVAVEVGTFVGRDGAPRSCVKKWFKPTGAASTAAPVTKPAASKAAVSDVPAWQADGAAPRAPRRGTAARAHAAFKANVAASAEEDDGSIPF